MSCNTSTTCRRKKIAHHVTMTMTVTVTPVLESDAEPGCEKFVQLGAWENAYFATRSKSRQKSVNCIILANLWILWRFLWAFIRHTLAWPRLTVKTCFCRLPEIQQALGARKSSKSCFFGQRLWLRAFSHQTFTMSVIIQMEFSCIEQNSVSGIRLRGQKY